MILMEAIFSHTPQHKKTDMNMLCRYLVESFTKEAAVVIVSDFIVTDCEQSLKRLVCKREVILVRCLDAIIRNIPDVGYVWGQDPETQSMVLLDFSSSQATQLQKILEDRIEQQNQLFLKCNIDCIDLLCDANFIRTLILFFKRRMAVP